MADVESRKIIQISTVRYDTTYRIIALCDDGTVWAKDNPHYRWYRISNVPQPHDAPSPSKPSRLQRFFNRWFGDNICPMPYG